MRIIFFVLSSWLMISCDMDTTMEIEIPSPKERLVANCYFAADSIWTVDVWKSTNALAAKNPSADRVLNATVVIMDGNLEIPFFYNERYKFFRTSSRASTGKPYTLMVSAPGYETITSTVTIPEPVQIEEVKSEASPDPELDGYLIRTFEIRFKDPGHQVNHYALTLTAVRKLPWPPHNPDYIPINTKPLNPTFADDYSSEWYIPVGGGLGEYNLLFNDRTFNGREYIFKVTATEYVTNEDEPLSYKISLKSLTEEYYNYRVTSNMQMKTKNDPFAQHVQVFSNIQNGYGIFAGYSQSLVTHWIK